MGDSYCEPGSTTVTADTPRREAPVTRTTKWAHERAAERDRAKQTAENAKRGKLTPGM